MLKLRSICLATLLAFATPFSTAQSAPVAAVTDESLSAAIDASIAHHFKGMEPGATVIVTKDGKTVFRKAYGMADVAKGQAMSPEHSLRLGSITKQFTAVAIQMLAEEGKLALADEIGKFLPGYPTRGKRITIEHLLTHTSGIVSYTSKRNFRSQSTKDLTVDQMIATFKDDGLEFEPGARYAYNNSGYFLLGAIIEKVSGMPYAKFVEQRIFVPLGMTQTAYEGHERAPTLRAMGHARAGSGFEAASPISMSQPYAAGSLVSTVDDMARWDAALAGGALLKPASWKQAVTPYLLADGKSTHYGYGWMISSVQGAPSIGHGGGINGYAAFALRLPEQKVYVAVLTNSESGIAPAEMIAAKAAAAAIGKPYAQPRAIRLSDQQLDAFAGLYKGDDKHEREIRRDRQNLVMHRAGRAPVILQAYADNAFFMDDGLSRFEFVRDGNGVITHITVLNASTPLVYQRIGNAAPDPSWRDAY